MTTIYTPLSEEIQTRVIELFLEGVPLRDMNKADEQVPSAGRIIKELSENPKFERMFEEAKRVYAHAMAEDILAIADDGRNDRRLDHNGKTIVDFDNIKRSELRVKVRKELMEKMNVTYYGKVDRQEIQVNHSNMLAGMSPDQIAEKLDQIREAAMLRREARLKQEAEASRLAQEQVAQGSPFGGTSPRQRVSGEECTPHPPAGDARATRNPTYTPLFRKDKTRAASTLEAMWPDKEPGMKNVTPTRPTGEDLI